MLLIGDYKFEDIVYNLSYSGKGIWGLIIMKWLTQLTTMRV